MVNLILMTQTLNVDELSDLCLSFGALSVSVIPDSSNDPWYREPGEVRHWTVPKLTCLMENESECHTLVHILENQFSRSIDYAIQSVPERDWVTFTQEQFKPLQIANKLWIIPPWELTDQYAKPILVMNPGLAFGTGTHPTTRLVLNWISTQSVQNLTIIDWGCGSGILGLAALKLGAKSAFGVDIDSQALHASEENGQLNHIEFTTYLPENVPNRQADLILANILLNPLIKLESVFIRHLNNNGRIILTGVLESQIDTLKANYKKDFALEVIDQEKNWVLLLGVRRD